MGAVDTLPRWTGSPGRTLASESRSRRTLGLCLPATRTCPSTPPPCSMASTSICVSVLLVQHTYSLTRHCIIYSTESMSSVIIYEGYKKQCLLSVVEVLRKLESIDNFCNTFSFRKVQTSKLTNNYTRFLNSSIV